MTDKVDISGKPPRRAGQPADTEGPRQFGLGAAMALIAGSTFVKFAALAFMATNQKRTTTRKEMSWLP
jgi:hypothetical protein